MKYRSLLPEGLDIEDIPFIYDESVDDSAAAAGRLLTMEEIVAISLTLSQLLEEAVPVKDSWAQSARVSLLR